LLFEHEADGATIAKPRTLNHRLKPWCNAFQCRLEWISVFS